MVTHSHIQPKTVRTSSNQWRSQPDYLVSLCKFPIIIIIHCFRNWFFSQSVNTKYLHSGTKSSAWLRFCFYYVNNTSVDLWWSLRYGCHWLHRCTADALSSSSFQTVCMTSNLLYRVKCLAISSSVTILFTWYHSNRRPQINSTFPSIFC